MAVAAEDLKELETKVDGAVHDADVWLDGQAARFPWKPPPEAREVCLAQVQALADRLFREIASATIVDDSVVATEPSTRRWFGHPRGDWTTVPNWQFLLAQVETLGIDGAALVVQDRPGAIGHAFTIVNLAGTDAAGDPIAVRYIADAQANKRVVPAGPLPPPALRAASQRRALFITPTADGRGKVTRPPNLVPVPATRPGSVTAVDVVALASDARIGMLPTADRAPTRPTRPWWGMDTNPPTEEDRRQVAELYFLMQDVHLPKVERLPSIRLPEYRPSTSQNRRQVAEQYFTLDPSAAKHLYRYVPIRHWDLDLQRLAGFDDPPREMEATYAQFREVMDKYIADFTARAGVESEVPDERLRNRNDLIRNVPELSRYLQRKDKSRTVDKNDPAGASAYLEKVVIVGGARITFRYEKTLETITAHLRSGSVLEQRIEWVRQAVQLIQKAGRSVPDVEILIPKYTRSVKFRYTRCGAVDVTFAPPGEFGPLTNSAAAVGHHGIVICEPELYNMTAREASDITDFAWRLDKDREVALLVHEFGHIITDSSRRNQLDYVALKKPTMIHLVRKVSEYAAEAPNEFLAEYFVGLIFGRNYRKEFGDEVADFLEELYYDLGGPGWLEYALRKNRGLQVHKVDRDGDCFFSALLATGPHLLGGMTSQAGIRAFLVDELLARPELRAAVAPTVQRFLAEGRADEQLRITAGQYQFAGVDAAQAQRNAQDYLERTFKISGREGLITSFTYPVAEKDWKEIAGMIRTPRSWNNVVGDIVPTLTALVYRLRIEAYSPDALDPAAPYDLINGRPGSDGHTTGTMVLVRSRDTHWDATEPITAVPPPTPAPTRNPEASRVWQVFKADTADGMRNGLAAEITRRQWQISELESSNPDEAAVTFARGKLTKYKKALANWNKKALSRWNSTTTDPKTNITSAAMATGIGATLKETTDPNQRRKLQAALATWTGHPNIDHDPATGTTSSPKPAALTAPINQHGPLRRAHTSTDLNRVEWRSPYFSAHDANHNPLPPNQQACVSVTVITLM